MRLKPDQSTNEMAKHIRAAEQPGSGLIHSLMMRDQTDPTDIYALVVFESEEKARAREQDPRRAEQLGTVRSIMADILVGPPEFTDLEVVDEWGQAT
jgi:hypothetical protein